MKTVHTLLVAVAGAGAVTLFQPVPATAAGQARPPSAEARAAIDRGSAARIRWWDGRCQTDRSLDEYRAILSPQFTEQVERFQIPNPAPQPGQPVASIGFGPSGRPCVTRSEAVELLNTLSESIATLRAIR